MKIEIQAIKDRGNLAEERVVLKVLTETDIGRYLLGIGRSTGEKSVSTDLSRTLWFPDKPVSAGDFVAIYTKAGTRGQFQNKSESVTHTFFLGLENSLWRDDRLAVILLEIADWRSRRASEN